MHTDGTNQTKLNNEPSGETNVSGEWVYYSAMTDGGKFYGPLCKIRTDGSGKTKLNNDKTYDINVAGDWIYYRNDGDDCKLYRIKNGGSNRELVR